MKGAEASWPAPPPSRCGESPGPRELAGRPARLGWPGRRPSFRLTPDLRESGQPGAVSSSGRIAEGTSGFSSRVVFLLLVRSHVTAGPAWRGVACRVAGEGVSSCGEAGLDQGRSRAPAAPKVFHSVAALRTGRRSSFAPSTEPCETDSRGDFRGEKCPVRDGADCLFLVRLQLLIKTIFKSKASAYAGVFLSFSPHSVMTINVISTCCGPFTSFTLHAG